MSKKTPRKPNKEIALQMLAQLEEDPNMSQRGLASELGISLGSVNYCLKALVAKGHVKAGSFSRNPNKLGYAYLLTPSGIREKAKLTASFLKRKQAEYYRLEKEIADLEIALAREAKDVQEPGE